MLIEDNNNALKQKGMWMGQLEEGMVKEGHAWHKVAWGWDMDGGLQGK